MDRAGLPSLRSGCASLRVSSFGKWGPYGWVDLGCRTLFESPHTAGWASVAGLSLRVPIRRDCMTSCHAVLICKFPPPETWLIGSCADTGPLGLCWFAEILLRISGIIIAVMHGTSSCARTLARLRRAKGSGPALNAIAPALGEGWGDGGQGGIRTRGDITASHAFQACAFDHSATCPGNHRSQIGPRSWGGAS